MWYHWIIALAVVLIIWRTIVVLKETPENESVGGFFKRFACGKTYTGC